MKKIISMMLLTCIIFTLVGCSKSTFNMKEEATGDVKTDKSKLQVVVSFNPLKEFAEAVGKDKIQVKTVIPEGVEPHDFEPKIKDMKSISDGDIFIYSGFGMEGWVPKTLDAIDNKDLVVVNSSLGINPLRSEEDEVQEHEIGRAHV